MMNRRRSAYLNMQAAALFAMLLVFTASTALAGMYQAFSLSEARRLLQMKNSGATTARIMAGITLPVACIFDETIDDIILIGQVDPMYSEIHLDDLVVAMRAVVKHGESPLVSIDPAPEGDKSGDQIVRFAGKIENTQFGKDLLDADVVLKKLGLGKVGAEVWGVRSYFDLSAEEWRRTGKEDCVLSRFWFLVDPNASAIAARKGVGLVKRLKIKVQTEVSARTVVSEVGKTANAADPIGGAFADSLTENLDDLMLAMPELRRLDQLYRLVGVASLVEKWRANFGMELKGLHYWLSEAPVKKVETRPTYPLLSSVAKHDSDSGASTMTISGGIELRALVSDVRSGSLTALRDLVLRSKPIKAALTWEVPIGDALNDIVDISHSILLPETTSGNAGMNLWTRYDSVARPSLMAKWSAIQVSPVVPQSSFRMTDIRVSQRVPDVGGVMLENVADVTGDSTASPLDMAGAKFSFIVDGEDARLDPQTFRKFITALWAVYYSDKDPGISIDPIAPGAEKHLVRYIGQVINTDLGRVMREADYLMKKWVVGTEKPEISHFKNPLEYAAEDGMLSVGAWSRFWFVPEDMQFRRSDNMLLFESGKMTVQTEYMFQGFGSGADPSNRKFAEFFTDNYQKIAKKYPIYEELYEYAKMVSLAKYLKESGVPLFWFLMANKDLVITEDSTSTVDALVKSSKRFQGIQVEGGVDLCSEGQYIYDNEAVIAINRALAKLPSNKISGITSVSDGKIFNKTVSDPFSFTFKDRSLTVLPQHSSSSGKDYRGLRYQTDFAVKETGYQLTDNSRVDLKQQIFRLKYAELLYNAAKKEPSGNIELILNESWQKAERVSEQIDRRLKAIINQDFKSKARFHDALNKYFPKDELQKWKKIITQYAFYNTSLELVRCFHPRDTRTGSFGQGWELLVPYQLKFTGKEVTEFMGLILPKQIAFIDKLSGRKEILTFSDSQFKAAAYVPEDIKYSQVVGLFPMTDGTYRLLDKIKNEFVFNSSGYLTEMIFSDIHQIKFEYQKDFEVKLDNPSYAIERVSEKWIKYRGIYLPEIIRIKNLSDGSGEVVCFTKDKAIIGYAPEKPETSQFEFLALMSDLSYRLVDKKENEIVFDSSGKFDKIISTSENLLVRSMSSGNYNIYFNYKFSKLGKPVVAQAKLIKNGKDDSEIIMQYSYDNDGRLSKAVIKDKQNIDSASAMSQKPQSDLVLLSAN